LATLYAIISKIETFKPMNRKLIEKSFDDKVALDTTSIDETEAKSQILSVFNLKKNCKVCFLQKGNSLIYVAVSKDFGESQYFLRRQLEVLHMQLISITT